MDRNRSHYRTEGVERPPLFGFGRVNIALLTAGVVAVFVGYRFLGNGSTTIAPLLLILGYAVLVPAGLLWGLRDRSEESSVEGE